MLVDGFINISIVKSLLKGQLICCPDPAISRGNSDVTGSGLPSK